MDINERNDARIDQTYGHIVKAHVLHPPCQCVLSTTIAALVLCVLLLATASVYAQDPRIQTHVADLVQGDPATRRAAIQNLIHTGKAVIPEVTPLLQSPDAEVRVAALAVLERVQATEALDQISASLSDRNTAVRRAAANALGRLGDERAVPHLLRALGDPDEVVRVRSITALGLLDAKTAVPSFLNVIRRKDLADAERQAAIVTLGHLRAVQAADDLLRILNDDTESEKTRGATAAALGEIQDRRAVGPIIALLTHPSAVIRFHAVSSLGTLGGSDAESALIMVIRNRGEQNFIRIRAAAAIASLRSDAGIQELFRVAREEEEFMAMHAVRVLMKAGVPGSKQAALELKTRSQDPFVLSTLEKLIRGEGL